MGDGVISQRLRRFTKVFGLSSTERRLILQAWYVLAAFRIGLWLLPARRTGPWIRNPAPSADLTREPRVPPEEIARAVVRAATLVPGASCLVQALGGSYLIRKAGGPAAIHIGVTSDADGFKAHAWLESEGRILIGGATAASYTPLQRPGRGDNPPS